jgi:hypothetical protein
VLLLNDLHPQVRTIGNSELRQRIFSWQRFLLDRAARAQGTERRGDPLRRYRLRCRATMGLQRGSEYRSYEAEFSGVACANCSIAAPRVSFLVIAS